MELTMLKERETPLMSRKRYTFEIDFKGATPTRRQIRDAVATKVKGEPELTVIKHIYNRYGVEKAKVITHIYTDKKAMEKFEEKDLLDKHLEKKKEPKEEKKEEAKPAEAPKEEAAPAEEKKAEEKKE
jgi:small subunit ribosomal protein S24e